MPWTHIKLNDGTLIPSIAFGTWQRGNGQVGIDITEEALSVGFEHIDTAQMYRNETEAGQALRESGLARSDVYITTKWSGMDGLDIAGAIQQSLKNLNVSYVDLYLIHFPSLAKPDIPTVWAQMEKVKTDGLAKNIGISNFSVGDMQVLLASAKIKPAVNQISLHLYNYAQEKALLEFAKENSIVIAAFGVLIPVTSQPNGPLKDTIAKISERLDVTPDQVLVAWAKAKGVVVVASSSKVSRLKGYIAAGDLTLTEEDIKALDGGASNAI